MIPLVTVGAEAAADTVRAVVGLLDRRPLVSRARWSPGRARQWSDRTGWLMGANFTPSTAGNQLELWQRATFDPATIDRELGWAAELGMNSIRLFLHDLVWRTDGEEFLARVDTVLGLAERHGIVVMPVLFDGIWDTHPVPGTQRAPVEGVHNSIWVQSPGAAILGDPSRWESLRPYVESVLARFGTDPRVVAWDLFNEPDSPNPAYRHTEVRRKRALTARLVDRVFDWAQAAGPEQPLTVGVYLRPSLATEHVTATSRISLERSDVISFHSYAPARTLLRTIERLGRLDRPLLCTEWLGRPRSPADLIDVLADHDVDAWCWGLVDGRTQTRLPWTTWVRASSPTAPWFHELLRRDGSPYDPAEAARFRRVAARRRGERGDDLG